MQFKIYDRQTLAYKDSGYVASYTIDDDYIVNNNSTIKIIKGLKDNVVVGDVIALIKTSGAYHKGIITTFDNANFSISYKSDKELFNDNMLNPCAGFYADSSNDGIEVARKFGITDVADLIDAYFGKSTDWLRQLPIKMETIGNITDIKVVATGVSLASVDKTILSKIIPSDSDEIITLTYNGSNWGTSTDILQDYGITLGEIPTNGNTIVISREPAMLWTWQDETINIADWLVELFGLYNLSLSWTINFDIANEIFNEIYKVENENGEKIEKITTDKDGNIIIKNERNPYYIITLTAITSNNKLIKDNVVMQTITYTERKTPEATVCAVLDDATKEIYKMSSSKNLINPYQATKNKFLDVDEDYAYEKTEDDTTSNISGYIPVKSGNGVKYTISSSSEDSKIRNIVFYDKDKKLVYWKLNNGKKVFKFQYVFTSFNSNVGRYSSTIEFTDDVPKYCKICYYNKAEEVQFEKGDTPTKYDGYDISAIYYLCEKGGDYYVSLNANEQDKDGLSLRVMPSKFTTVTYDSSDEDNKITPQEAAENTLIPSKFNQAIEIQIGSNSKMFEFESSFLGDLYKIVNEHGTIDSVYTGRKEESNNKYITLYFGLGRQNYTDLIQMTMRKNKYKSVYNKK